MNISTTYIAGIVSIFTLVLPIFGLEIAEKETLTELMTQVIGAVGAVYVLYGRYKAGGVNAFGLRKK
jgi:hypothetical protein